MTDTDEKDHQRHGRSTELATLVRDAMDGVDIESLGRSAEWWAQRDREIAEQRARDVAALERARMAQRAGDLRENHFPEMFVTAALGELEDTPAMRHAQLFPHLPKKIIVFAGGVGAGKTTAAAWLALKGQDPRPAFARISELERRGRYDRNLDDWLKDKTSLVIDDVGAEVLDGKNVFRSLFDEIVDMFYGNRRTLVMTTNLRPKRANTDEQEQFVERYGDRVASRVAQSGVWAECGMRDLRKEKPV
jgi:DNA replication protein DnaC